MHLGLRCALRTCVLRAGGFVRIRKSISHLRRALRVLRLRGMAIACGLLSAALCFAGGLREVEGFGARFAEARFARGRICAYRKSISHLRRALRVLRLREMAIACGLLSAALCFAGGLRWVEGFGARFAEARFVRGRICAYRKSISHLRRALRVLRLREWRLHAVYFPSRCVLLAG